MIVLVGPSSFLAREFLKLSNGFPIVSLKHSEFSRIQDIPNVECVINFAFAPELYTQDYRTALDIDSKLGRYVAGKGIHYVMVSSRKVYSHDAQWNAREDSPAAGQDAYGRNKLLIEESLIKILGNNLTILRPGNVIGFERQPERVRFGAYLLNQLASNGEIRLTVSPFVRRDVVPVDYFCEVLAEVVVRKPGGIFNVGAEQALEVGKIALWMLDGFGHGKLIVESSAEIDEFQLDSRKLATEFGLTCNAVRLQHFCKKLGAMLRAEIRNNVPRN